MAEELNVDAQAVPRRCTVKSPDYSQLTPLDWVVLDFTDGLCTFSSLLTTIPTTKSDLAASFIHLRLLGLLTWSTPSQQEEKRRSGGSSSMGQQKSAGGSQVASQIAPGTMPSAFPDDLCAQYLPPRLFQAFRSFKPNSSDPSLDLSIEMQYFTEFLHQNLSSLSPYDLLGLTEGQCRKADAKQAYLLRTKQFHPDRYFRKNLGSFAPKIAAIFKAVTGAFSNLQSKLKS